MAWARAALRSRLAETGEISGFGFAALKEVPGSLRYTAEILRQLAILIRTSMFFIAGLCFFIGFSMTTFGYYILASFGAVDFAGALSGIFTARITVPFVYGFAFTAMVGCSLVAEIGAMRINEEIDAYEAEGVSAMRYVVAPRVIAAILLAPIAGGLALSAAAFGAWLNLTTIVGDMNSASFWRYHWALQGIPDILFALMLMTVLGVLVTLVSCFYGYTAKGGPEGVGAAVARSLVVNLPLVWVVVGVLQFAFYNEDLGLPIGG